MKKTRSRAFNHEKVAAALSAASNAKLDPLNLAIQGLTPSPDGTAIAFNLAGKRWSCDVEGAKCADTGAATTTVGEAADPPAGGRGGRGGGRGGAAARTSTDGKPLNMSPDGKRGIFIRDWNLWVRDVATGQERQLTTDGVKDFGYATDNAGWTSSDRAIALWSPDSKKIATQQQDERKVGDMYLVETGPGHPVLRAWKYPLPGDQVVAMLHRVIIDVDTGKTVRLQMAPDFHRAMSEDNIDMGDYIWSPDGSKLALASVSIAITRRSTAQLADATTGDVRTVFDETVTTHVQTRVQVAGPVADQRSALVLAARRLGQSLSLRSHHRPAEEPDHHRRRARHADRSASTRRRGRCGTTPSAARRDRIRTSRTSTASGSTARTTCSLTPDNGTHTVQLSPTGKYVDRHVLDSPTSRRSRRCATPTARS